ncbi:HEAT repeat domain-containing protein [bacterium]|nr:HEAT repeat domain-containing protein [bacterium]
MTDLMSKKLQQLLSELNSSDAVTRKYAAEDLGELKNKKAIKPLIALFDDYEKTVQEASVEALKQIGGRETVAAVSPLLRSEKAPSRNFAADILVEIGNSSIKELGELIHDHDHDVRKFAVDILGLIGSEEATEQIIKALNDPHINVVCGAVEALGNIGDNNALKALINLLGKADDSWLKFMLVESIGKLKNASSLKVLHKMFNEADPILLASVIGSVGSIGHKDSVLPLISALDTLPEALREVAIDALNKIDILNEGNIFQDISPKVLLEKIVPLVLEDNIQIRRNIARILADIPHEESLDTLIFMLSDKSSEVIEVVKQSIISLAPIPKEKIKYYIKNSVDKGIKEFISIIADLNIQEDLTDILLSFVDNAAPEIRSETAASLGKLNNNQAVEALIKLCSDSDREVQINAINSLGSYNDSRATQTLFEYLISHSDELSKTAMSALKEIELDAQTIKKLVKELSSTNVNNQISCACVLSSNFNADYFDLLIPSINNSLWEVRKMVVDNIGKFKRNELKDYLITALNDDERYVRIAAVSALSNLKDVSTIKYIKPILSENDEHMRHEAVISLKKFPVQEIGDILVACLNDDSEMIRLAAIDAIGELKYKEALPALEQMLDREMDEISFAIEEAINKIK